MKPLEFCIKQYGGVIAFTAACGVSRQLIYRWRRGYGEGRNAQGGNVPQKYWDRIVEHAEANGIDVTMHDLVHGRN